MDLLLKSIGVLIGLLVIGTLVRQGVPLVISALDAGILAIV
jgi:hypothetical protein